MIFKTLGQLSAPEKLSVDDLVYTAMFSSEPQVKIKAAEIIYQLAVSNKSYPASIQNLYLAAGRKEVGGFTVPAMNVRTLTYDTARIIFRLAKKLNAGTFIFEIARTEQTYTAQNPQDYATAVLAAAVRENYRGPVFLQGDHYQFKVKNFQTDRETEIERIKTAIRESIAAHFYNIDIDGSTLVDLEKSDLKDQQKNNYEMTALMTEYIRKIQPGGITVSVGGEIGHIGGKNSTPDDFVAFMDNYLNLIKDLKGISKVSVQTGTSHGGTVLPDGKLADVKLDFSVLKNIGGLARDKYRIGGPVQHGASTLPEDLFNRFPENHTLEIHLATGFQNTVYQFLPEKLKNAIYQWIRKNCSAEKQSAWNDEQFIYKLRKKALGPFKQQLWEMSENEKVPVLSALEKQLEFLFNQLNIAGTAKFTDKYIR